MFRAFNFHAIANDGHATLTGPDGFGETFAET